MLTADKQQKQINGYFEQLNDAKNWEPRKRYLILKTLYYLIYQQGYDIEKNLREFDISSSVNYNKEKYKACLENQNNLINIGKHLIKLKDDFKRYIVDKRIDGRTKWNIDTGNHIKGTWFKLNGDLKIRGSSDVEKLFRDENIEEIRKFCPSTLIDKTKEELTNSLKNEVRLKIGRIKEIYPSSKIDIADNFLDEILEINDWEKIDEIFNKQLNETIDKVFLLTQLDEVEDEELDREVNKLRGLIGELENEIETASLSDNDKQIKNQEIEYLKEELKQKERTFTALRFYDFLYLLDEKTRRSLWFKDENSHPKQPEYREVIIRGKWLNSGQIELLFPKPLLIPTKKDELKQIIDDLIKVKDNLEKDRDNLEDALKRKGEETLEFQTKLDWYKETASYLVSEFIEYRSGYESEINILQDKINALEKSLEQKDKLNKYLNKEIDRLKEKYNKKVQELEKELEESQSRIGKVITKYEEEKREWEQQIIDRETQILFLLGNKGKGKADELINKENLIAEGDKLRKELEQKNEELTVLRSQSQNLAVFLKNNGRLKEGSTADMGCVNVSVKETVDDLQGLQSRNAYLREHMGEMSRSMTSKTNQIIFQQSQIDNLQTQLTDLERASQVYYDTSEEDKLELQRQIEELKEKVKEAEEYHLKYVDTSAKWNKERFDRLDEEKQELIDIISDKNDELEDLEVKLTLLEIESDKKSSEQSEKALEELNKLCLHYEERINKLKEEIIKLGIKNNELDTQGQELKENKNHVIIQQWQELNQAKTEIEKWIKKYQQEHKRFIQHDAQLAKATKKYEKLKKKYQARGAEIKSLESLEQELKELKDQHNKTKKQKAKIKTRLGEQVDNLGKLEKSKEDVEKELKIVKDDNDHLEFLLEVRTKQRDRARSKLKVIKDNKQKLKDKAQDKGVCMTLIKWEDITEKYHKDNSLVKALDDTQHNLVDVIVDTQNYLGVDNLTEITTTHQIPQGKNLKDLIEFYKNPPTAPSPPHNTYIEVEKEVPIEVEVPKVVIKPAEKIVDTPFGEDLEVIKNVDLNSLEKELEIVVGKEVKEKMLKATSYQELVSIREGELKKHLSKQGKNNISSTELVQPNKNHLEKWWIGLIILLVLKGLVIVGLTTKLIKKSSKKIK